MLNNSCLAISLLIVLDFSSSCDTQLIIAIDNFVILFLCHSLQFSAWVDAVIFVFSLENEASFNAIYAYYTKMSHYRNAAEIPIILVGTQGEF